MRVSEETPFGAAAMSAATAIGPALTLTLALVLAPGRASAQPLDMLESWEGAIDYHVTGAPLAIDGPDSGTSEVDTLNQPASVEVTSLDVPAGAWVVAAYLYWAGTIDDQGECATSVSTDMQVLLTTPDSVLHTVTADECFCVPGATSYDIQACRSDVTMQVHDSGMIGIFTVDGFTARIRNGSTDNASFSLVLVFEHPSALPPRRIAVYDGLQELYLSSVTMSLPGLDADTPAHGDLAWYVLDGDPGGVPPESVSVLGVPGGSSAVLQDPLNPADNPMNRTINTVSPPMEGVVGVDIDMLDLSGALTPGDTAVEMTYSAGGDKYWVVWNIVGINVYKAVIPVRVSNKRWLLEQDPDSTGTPTPGDTIRYNIHLENVGTAPGYVTVTDTIPAQFSSWNIVEAAGGTDDSTADELVVRDIFLSAGGAADVVFDAVIADGTLGQTVSNVADFDSGPEGNAGSLVAPPLLIGGWVPDDPLPEDAAETPDAPDALPDPESDPDAPSDMPADTADDDTMDGTADTTGDTVIDTGSGGGGGGGSGCSCAIPR